MTCHRSARTPGRPPVRSAAAGSVGSVTAWRRASSSVPLADCPAGAAAGLPPRLLRPRPASGRLRLLVVRGVRHSRPPRRARGAARVSAPPHRRPALHGVGLRAARPAPLRLRARGRRRTICRLWPSVASASRPVRSSRPTSACGSRRSTTVRPRRWCAAHWCRAESRSTRPHSTRLRAASSRCHRSSSCAARAARCRSGPIKGTAHRPNDPARAVLSLQQLQASAKDAAEHVMIVDLMRNDIGRVCEYGSVQRAAPTDRRGASRPLASGHRRRGPAARRRQRRGPAPRDASRPARSPERRRSSR